MDLLGKITQAELELWHLIAPYVGIVVAIIGGQMVLRWTKNVGCGIAFRMRGFKPNHLIRVEGNLYRITRIGMTSTSFRLIDEGPEWEEHPEVLNSRLEYLAIRRIVPKVRGHNVTNGES